MSNTPPLPEKDPQAVTNENASTEDELNSGVDVLGLLAEAGSRDNSDEEEVDDNDEEPRTPEDADESEPANDLDDQAGDESNQDQLENDEIDINDENVVLQYVEESEAGDESNSFDNNFILNVVSLAGNKDEQTATTAATEDMATIQIAAVSGLNSESTENDDEMPPIRITAVEELNSDSAENTDEMPTIQIAAVGGSNPESAENIEEMPTIRIAAVGGSNPESAENVDENNLHADNDSNMNVDDKLLDSNDPINDTSKDQIVSDVKLHESDELIKSSEAIEESKKDTDENIATNIIEDPEKDKIDSHKDAMEVDPKNDKAISAETSDDKKDAESHKNDETTEDNIPKEKVQRTFSEIEILDSSDDECASNKNKNAESDIQSDKNNANSTVCEELSKKLPSDAKPSEPANTMNIVDLDDSSSEDEMKSSAKSKSQFDDLATISVQATSSEEIKSSGDNNASTILQQDSKENTASTSKNTEEVFNLDSDDENAMKKKEPESPREDTIENGNLLTEIESPIITDETCVNPNCPRSSTSNIVPCPLFVLGMLKIKRVKRTKHPGICEDCLDAVAKETQTLVGRFRAGVPLFESSIPETDDDPVEILDSDSDDDDKDEKDGKELIPYTAREPLPQAQVDFFVENLTDALNEVCRKYDFIGQIKKSSKAIADSAAALDNETLNTIQEARKLYHKTVNLKTKLYNTIKIKTTYLPELLIPSEFDDDTRFRKSDISTINPISREISSEGSSMDLQPDILLPPVGVFNVGKLAIGQEVYTIKQSILAGWIPATIVNLNPVGTPMANGKESQFSFVTVKFKLEGKPKIKPVTGRQIAFSQPAKVRYPVGTRVIALFKDMTTFLKKDTYYCGIIAESPLQTNRFRYLVFFDDGYAQYVYHEKILPVAECSPNAWDDVFPDSRDFVKKYLMNFPDRPMVRMQKGQILKTEKDGSWWDAKVIELDASLALLRFTGPNGTSRDEWIYRGSTRLSLLYQQLQAAVKRPAGRYRSMGAVAKHPFAKSNNTPYVEYTRNIDEDIYIVDDDASKKTDDKNDQKRAVAKKSTTSAADKVEDLTPEVMDIGTKLVKSRVVFYSPKVWVRPEKMVPHECSENCQNKKALSLWNLRTYNPLVRPLLSAWERQIVKYKNKRCVLYKAPCGRRLRSIEELHKYLMMTESQMSVDLFDFDPSVQCFAEFVIGSSFVSKPDISHGEEAVPIVCVNYYDHSLPEFWNYSVRREPTEGVNMNLDEDFLCACDCTDDCQDKEKCQCWQLTFEGVKYLGMSTENVGYQYKRLHDVVSTGIYECNSRCKCSFTCLNRVVQHPLQLRLQIFKTNNRGWGIRTLNDIPKGSFICIYAGNLLTDAVANCGRDTIDGDKYLADLDYIEVIEKLKEDYEADVPDELKIKPEKNSDDEEEEVDMDDTEEYTVPKDAEESDEEFTPHDLMMPQEYSEKEEKRTLRPRRKPSDDDPNGSNKRRKIADTLAGPSSEASTSADAGGEPSEMITISDDEGVREPSRFAVSEGFRGNDDEEYVPKYKSVRSYFGNNEAVYIMDARVKGNIGRYLNHSCSPNVFVQNVFVDTHDPRFPWVSFFALNHIRSGTELTWNYNYEIGCVPGKVIYCRCGAPNCRGRLL